MCECKHSPPFPKRVSPETPSTRVPTTSSRLVLAPFVFSTTSSPRSLRSSSDDYESVPRVAPRSSQGLSHYESAPRGSSQLSVAPRSALGLLVVNKNSSLPLGLLTALRAALAERAQRAHEGLPCTPTTAKRSVRTPQRAACMRGALRDCRESH